MRTEEPIRQLEQRDTLQLRLVDDGGVLRVIPNRTQRLGSQIRLTAIQHQDRIERRRVERGWNAAPDSHESFGGGIS